MSRIAAVLSIGNAFNPGPLLASMLSVVRTDPAWGEKRWTGPGMGMGKCGEGSAHVAVLGPVTVVLEGNIYNAGDWPSPGTDAELFARLYEKSGFEGAMAAINGDCAVFLYDARTGTFYAGRDRFGQRPLYYLHQNGIFAAASRIRSLLVLPGTDLKPRFGYVARFAGGHYRFFDNEPELSPVEGVMQLAAGSWCSVKAGSLRKGQYWRMEDAPDWKGLLKDIAADYRELLQDAVRLRLKKADRQIFTLSGGMDSSSVLACAVRDSGMKQHAFSSVYTDKTYDESAEIQTMLGPCVSQWHRVHINIPDVMALVQRMVAAHDEPVATATYLSHFLLCEEVRRQGFRTIFGGLGGDELNAGEYDHFFYFFADLRAAGDEDRLSSEIIMWKKYHDHPIFRKDRDVVEKFFERMVDLKSPGQCRYDPARVSWYPQALLPEYRRYLAEYRPRVEKVFSSYLKNRTYQDMMLETIPCCLRAEDRQSKAAGLVNVLPFFDHRLAEFMFRVPAAMKYDQGVTKALLREAMKGILPEETRTRVKKTGWNAPAHIWFSGKGQGILRDIISSDAFRRLGVYDAQAVLGLLDDHEAIVSQGLLKDNHMMFFWQMVNLVIWQEEFSALRRQQGCAAPGCDIKS